MEPDGTVLVNEIVVPCVQVPICASRLHVGTNPQQTALEHITETYQVLGGKSALDAKSSAEALLGSLGLSERLDALPREMSGGEQRRVTLARVLALNPKLIVADEPTSGLDPDRRDSVLEALFGNSTRGCWMYIGDP